MIYRLNNWTNHKKTNKWDKPNNIHIKMKESEQIEKYLTPRYAKEEEKSDYFKINYL